MSAAAVARDHRVALPYPDPAMPVAHLGRCRCGWGFTYDATSHAAAVAAAKAHVGNALLDAAHAGLFGDS